MRLKKVDAAEKKNNILIKNYTCNIIAIGASAGGLEALQEFLAHLPALQNACVVIAQHLSPTHKSMLVQLLSRETNLEVEEALHNTLLVANKVYITPPDKDISISLGKIILSKPIANVGPKPSVDILFRSLEENSAEHLVGIILSGTGSDGAAGVKIIKKSGGLVLVQEPQTAKYNGMPLAAIETGEVDAVLTPDKMGEEIKEFLTNRLYNKNKIGVSEEPDSGIEKIIRLLSKRTGTDFSNYKSATINRRLEKRLAILKIKSIEDYLVLLEKNPRELDEMFNMVLIGVTTFFRDMEAFGVLENYLHKIINTKTNKDAIRIWVPGCSTGEEAYSIAILLHRILKDRTQNYNFQIFATDIDERAIIHARKGLYSITSLQDVPAEIVEQYFLKKEKDFELIKAIRSMVLFTKHDLTNNPPFLKLDLISCRNLLIYFGAGLQQQIIPIFHYALLQDAYLLLGKSETIGQFADLFTTLDAKNKFYQRKRGGNIHHVKFSAFKAQKQSLPSVTLRKIKTEVSISDLVKETLFNTYENPYVVINEHHDILETNGDLRLFLSLPQGSINVNLMKMVNPELQIEIRSVVTRTIKEREQVKSGIKKFNFFDTTFYVRVTAKPLIYTDASNELFLVVFERLDLDEFVSKGIVSSDTQLTDVRVEELENELVATKEHLQTYIEELETTNEEMQSLNEEMQSTNEELQSSNEELETTNEELQSTNEEIQITYAELKAANDELERKEKLLLDNEANISALLNNTLQAFILLDSAYKIVAFNEKASALFSSLREKKLQSNASFIDFIEPEQLERVIRDFAKVAKGHIINHELNSVDNAKNERWFSISYTPVFGADKIFSGISIGMLDITDLKIALSDLNDKERLISSVFDATSIGICITDNEGKFIDVNHSYCQIYGYAKDELIGNSFTETVAPALRPHTEQMHDDFLKTGVEMPAEWDMIKKDGTPVKVFVTASLLVRPDGSRCKVTSVRDISAQKLAEKEVSLLMNNTEECFALLDTNLNVTLFNNQVAKLYKRFLNIEIKIGDPAIKFTIPERIAPLQSLCKEVLAGEIKDSEVNFPVLDGGIRTFAFRFMPARDPDGKIEGVFITGKDITEARKAEKLIIDSEKRFRTLVENGADAILVLDAAINPIYVSPSSSKLFGYDNKEALALDFFSIIHPDDLQTVKNKIEECSYLPGQPVKNVEYRMKHKQGHWVYMSATIADFLDDPAINGIVANITDITLKKQFEDQLYNINNNIDCVIYRYQLNPDGTDKFIFVSPGSKKIWGIEADDALRDISLIWKLFFDEDVPKLIESIQESAKTQTEWTGDWRIHHPDGSTRWQRGRGHPQKLADGSVIWDSVIVDITQTKLADLEIERVKQNMESVINGTDDLIWSISPEMKIISGNRSYFKLMTNATKRTFTEGSPVILDEFGDELVVRWKAYYERALSGEKLLVKDSFFDPDKQKVVYTDTSLNPMRNDFGEIIGVACYAKDVTSDTLNLLELTKTKDELEKVMNSSLDIIISVDINNIILTVNIACKRILGYEPEELIGQPLFNYLFKGDKESTEAVVENVKQGNNITAFENRYIRKDGSLVPLIWSSTFDSETQIRYGIARDATEKKEQELKLRLSEQRFKSLVQEGADLIGIIDNAANYIYVSPTVEQVLGYKTEEFINKNAFDFIHQNDRELILNQFIKLKTIKKINLPPYRFINKAGDYRWIETTLTNLIDDLAVGGIVANSRDITGRIQSQIDLKKSEEKYKDLFEANPAPMFIWDFATLKIIDCNEETLLQYGYTRDEFLRLTIKDIRPVEDISLIEHDTQSEEVYTLNHKKVWRHQKKSGELMYVDITGHLFDYEGKRAVLIMAIDITGKFKAEEELRVSENMLAEAQRLAKMGSWNFDFRTDRLTWSDELYNVFGTDKLQFLETHQSFVDLVDPEYRDSVVATSKHTQLTGNPFNIIYGITTSAGEKRIIEEYGYGERDADGNVIRLFGTAQDVTERKETEKKIIEANERYEYVTQATSDIIWDWDLEQDTIFYAKALERLLGTAIGERKNGLSFFYDAIHPDDRHKLTLNAEEFRTREGKFWEEEYRLKRANGDYAFILDSGILIKNKEGITKRMVGSMRDITKQKQEQQYLKLLSSVITQTNDAVLITEAEPITGAGPKIVYINDAFTKNTGYEEKDILGKTPRILQGPKSNKDDLTKIRLALQNWHPINITILNYKKNGEEFWSNLSISPVTDEKGLFTHWISIQKDVTRAKVRELQKELMVYLTSVFGQALGLSEILEIVVKSVAEFSEFELGEAWLTTNNSNDIKRVATFTKSDTQAKFFSADEDKTILQNGEGFAGFVMYKKEIQFWENIGENEAYFKRKAAKKAGLRSACGIPLLYNEEVIGIFSFFTAAEKINFKKVELLFAELSSQIAIEIKRKQSERELNQLFTYAADIVAVIGIDGYFKKVNPAFCTMLDQTDETILNTPYLEFVHPDDQSRTIQGSLEIMESESTYLFENRYRTRTGKYIIISWTATCAKEEGLIFAVGKNITEKKELEELLSNTSAMARIGSWELNLISNELFWSPVTKEIHGLDASFQPTLESAMSFYKKGESEDTIRRVVAQCIEKGIAFNVEVQIITADGITEKWVKLLGQAEFMNGQCTRIYGSFQDIDDLKRNQIALAATLSEKNEILESIGDGFFAIDRNYVVTYWNKKAESIMKKSREEIIGKDLRDIYPMRPDRDSYVHYENAFRDQQVHVFETYTPEVECWFEAAVYPSTNALSIYFKDITERKLYEEEMRHLNESLKIQKTDLERSNKELEQFAYVASHDLQEPLRMVTSFLTQIEKKYDGLLDEKGRKYIHFAVDGALRMRGIILDLLAYSRAGRTDDIIEEVDLNEILKEVKLLLQTQISEKNAVIKFEKLPKVLINKTPMRQVLQNLIENALKYSKQDEKPQIEVAAIDEFTFWKIAVKDNGIGISSEYFEKIFIIFQRLHLKNTYSGTGLGLAVTKKIIDAIGGKIWVESEEGKGSIFYFTIPK